MAKEEDNYEDDATDEYKEAWEKDDYKDAKEKGNAFFKEGKYPEAVEQYTEAIKRDPSNPTYYSNRAAAYQKLMDFVKAVDDSKMAIEKDPKFTKAWMRKAGCEYFMKEYHT